jgi:hypothetical protein
MRSPSASSSFCKTLLKVIWRRAPVNFDRRKGQVLSQLRGDLHEENVDRLRVDNELTQRWIGAEPPVQVPLAVNLDGMVDQREASRGEDGLERNLILSEEAQPAVLDPSGSNQAAPVGPHAAARNQPSRQGFRAVD